MEISNVVRHPYFFLLPIGFVIVCVVLVFAFGFKSSVEPNFRQLSERYLSDDKKAKKKKIKDKKGIITAGSIENILAKPEHEHHPTHSRKFPDARMNRRDGSELREKPKFKKLPRDSEEKPIDFDEGEWETAFSRKDKKNRKKDDDNVPVQKKKENQSSNKNKTEYRKGTKVKSGEERDTSEASLFVVSSLEKLEETESSAMGNKKKKKLRKD